MQKARVTADIGKREQLYRHVQRRIREYVPWLLIAHSTVVLSMSCHVKNYVMEPLGMHRFNHVDLDV